MAIELKIDAPPGRFLAGGPLPVNVTLKNSSSSILQAPEAAFQSVFEYGLQSLDPNGHSYSLSAISARYERSDDHLPKRPIATSALAAGAVRNYSADLSALSAQPLAPGRYQLTAAFADPGGRVQSPPIAIELFLPRLRALSSVSAVEDARLGQVLIEVGADQSTTVLQRESVDERPDDGRLYPRVKVTAPLQIQGVAVAAEGEPARGVRWFAWLQNGPGGAAIGAGVAQGDAVFKRIDPVPLGMPVAELAPAGWQGNQEAASFAALAKAADGRLGLVVAAFSATGKSGVRTVALDGMAVPSRWMLRFHGAGAPLKLDLVSAEQAGGQWRVVRRAVDIGVGSVSVPVVLSEGPEPVAALALEPVKGNGPDVVDVLYAASGTQPRMLFRRLPLAGGKPLEESAFGIPLDAGGAPPADWQLSPTAYPQRVAAARFGGQLIGRHLSAGGKGFVLDAQAQGAGLLQLRSAGAALWATWVDTAQGLRFAKVP